MFEIWTVFSKMGVIFSRFRKKSSVELLENIVDEIKELEACSADTALRHRKITRQLMMYSSSLCVFLSVFLYFYFPRELETKIIVLVLLILSPILYYAVNWVVSWYYNRKIKSSHSRLKDLKKEKQRLLDEIMEKETYKVAKDVLEKYAPETLPNKYPPLTRINMQGKSQSMLHGNQIRSGSLTVMNQGIAPNVNAPRISNMPFQAALPAPTQVRPPNFPGSKSYMERMFEYLVGDGPNNRYALICSNCSTHNGMTLIEEFEYTAFKCYACKFFNPARKVRPIAPKLENEKSDQDHASDSDGGSSSLNGDNVKIEEIEDVLEKDEEEFDEARKIETNGEADDLGITELLQAKRAGEGCNVRNGEDGSSSEDIKTEYSTVEHYSKDEDMSHGTSTSYQDIKNKQIKSDSVLNCT